MEKMITGSAFLLYLLLCCMSMEEREREREREPDFSINQSVVPTDAYLHRLGT